MDRLGTTIGGTWRIDDRLGVGATATVYSAIHPSGRRVALRILHAWLRDDRELRARLHREAELAQAIEHSARVEVHGVSTTDDGTPFVMMELLRGCTVASIRTGRVEVSVALTIAERVLSFAAACHERGIVHRDLEPSNVFLTRAGNVKVFGLGGASVGGRRREQASGLRDTDVRADVFGVGKLLIHLVGRATVPTDVTELIDRATRAEPDERWPTARTMRAAVLACAGNLDRSVCSCRVLETASPLAAPRDSIG